MQSQSLSKSIDTLLSSHGLARLNDVQIAVLEGTLGGDSYPTLADRSTYTVEYLREVGARLWQLLAQALGEPVSKKNIRSVLHRYQQSLAVVALERQYFWGESIDVSIFYGRITELKTLTKWIAKDRCRSISIQAIGGMGKTALAVKLAQQVAPEFEFVVWKSLRNAPPLNDLLADLMMLLSRQQEIEPPSDPISRIRRLIDYLQQHRCLLIFDNIESILIGGSPHQYLVGYEGYGELFRQVAECTHQSCVLSTSREQIAEVSSYAGDRLPVRILPLGGLSIEDGTKVLDDKGLNVTIDRAQDLIALYDGNPLALKIISTSILELFDGKIAAFLDQGIAVFNGIGVLLERQFNRLSPVEAQVMYWLAIHREWVSVRELQADFCPALAPARLLESLEYLQGRSLIERKKGQFTQQPVVMEYVTEQLLTTIRAEICQQQPAFLLWYALMQAQAKDYLRESQIRSIVKPLLAMLESDLGGKESIDKTLKQLLAQLSSDSFAAGSYGAGNCLNLLCQLPADLTGLDLAGLSIRQADLRDVSLHQVNLAKANLTSSVFAESISDVYSVAISPDDRLVANSGSNGKISVWEVETGRNLFNICAHNSHTIGLIFTADSKQLISSSFDRFIKIWDVVSGECLQSWESAAPLYRIALSNDGQMLAAGGELGSILIWEVSTGKLLKNLTGHNFAVMDVAFQPQGNLLASAAYDATVKLWDLTTGECVNTLIGHTQIAFSVAFNPNGTQLVSSGFDTLIKIWDVQSGDCLQTMRGHSRVVVNALFSPNGQQIVSGSQDLTVRIWEKAETDGWQCIKVLQGHQNNIWSIAVNSTGKKLVSGDLSGVLKFWDVESGQCEKTLRSIPKAVRALALHPEGNILASSSEDCQIRLWDLNTDRCLSSTQAHQMAVWQIAFTPDGELLASCGMDGAVKLWDIVNNSSLKEHLQPLQTSAVFVLAVAFHPHAEILASGGTEIGLCFWNYRTRELLRHQTELGYLKTLNLAFHPTGAWIASVNHEPDITVWDVETGECYRTLKGHTSQNWAVAFHPQGDLLASGGEDNDIRIWQIHTGECHYILSGHTAAITGATFSPDGLYLASSSKDATVRIWDVATGECVRTLTGHTDLVNFVVYHPDPDRRLLASCSHDETIRLWNTETWECLKVLRPQRVYENMNITGATGLSPAQLATLKTLGAITRE